MGRFTELQGVEGTTETNLDTRSQGLLVGQGENTGVGDLGLDEGSWVQGVLGGELNANRGGGGAGLGVVGGLGTDFQDWGHLVVVAGGEDRQVVGGNEGEGVGGLLVTDTSGVTGQGGGLDVVGDGGTGGETVLAEGEVTVEGWTLEDVDEGSDVEGVLGVVVVDLDGLGGAWNNGGNQFGLEAGGQGVSQLQLGGEGVVVGPTLGDGEAGFLVDELGLQRGSNGLLGIGLTLGGEGDAVRSNGLGFQGDWGGVEEILGGDVVGLLGNVGECNGGHSVSYRRIDLEESQLRCSLEN